MKARIVGERIFARWPNALVGLLAVIGAGACEDDRIDPERPILRFAPESLEFGPVFVGETRELVFQVANHGRVEADLRVGDLPDWLVAEPEQIRVSPGGQSATVFSFRPGKAGAVRAMIALVGSDARLEVAVAGRGIEYRFVAPEALDFGEVRVGTPATHSLLVESRSEGTIRIEPSVRAAHGDFSAPPVVSLPPAAQVEVPIRFVPTWAAERRGELILRPCPDCEGTSVSLYGRGVAEVIDAVPRYLGFGEVPPGERKTLTVRLSNFGDASTSLVSAALLHAPGMPFELGAITLPRSLEPNESLELAVTFAPAHVVEATGTLRLQAGASVVDVELAGRCLPVLLAAAPASLDFGAVSKGTSTTRTVLIHRLGQQAATVTSLAIEGAGVFTATNGRELPAEVGEPLEVAVVFAPTADGPLASELVVRSDPGPQMLRVPLSGRGFDGPPCELAIVPNALRFGLVPTGEVRRREVLIENVGATACPIWDLALDPSGDSDFMLVEPASTEALLAAGESLRAVIEFTPAEPRLVPQGTALTFSAHPASRPPVRVPITGQGTALRVLADPDPLDFGRVPIGGRALRSLDVRNEGERMVRIEAIELAGGDSAAFGLEFLPPVGYSLAPGAAFSVPAIFTPAATGRHRAELAIWIEDQGEPVLAGFVGEGVEEPCGEACRPQASCPGDRIVHIHEAVDLRGAGIDADGGPLTCAWAVVAAPVGSAPEIEVLDGCVARFRPDVVGRYRVELSVSDGTGERSACDLTVEAVPLPPLWIETVWSGDDDVDVHLFHPGAGDPGTAAAWFHPVYDCHFSNLAPYWDGASRDDDPFLDRDDRTGRGPEIVYIGSPNTEHDYVVGAHWFQSANGNPSQVVRTRIYCGGVLVAELETALEGPGLATVIGAFRYSSTETCTFTPDGRVLGVDP